VSDSTPRFRRIHLSQITARQVQYAAAFLYGLAEMPIEDVSFDDIAISMAVDAVPGHPAMAPDLTPMQRAGFFACNVQGLRLRDVEIADHLGPALIAENVSNLEISGRLARQRTQAG
jgi:hypothetical protein